MKQTRTGKIGCAAHGCQRVATHQVEHAKRSYGKPYPAYYCEYHARPFMAACVSRTGFSVASDMRHILRQLEAR